MAKQTGILPIEGTIGNLTFYKSQDGYMVKTKSGVTKDRIQSDDAFERTRENNAEFGRSGKGAKLLRKALRNIISKAKDRRMVSRLTARMLKVVQADEVNDRGMRNVIDGEAALLEGFDFNNNAKLSATIYTPYLVEYDTITGKATVTIASFIPKVSVAAPAGVTHFRLFAGIASISFEKETFEENDASSDYLVYDNNSTDEISLPLAITAGSTDPVFIVFGIEFLQSVNKKMYSLNNGAFNACLVAKVSTPE